MKILLLVIGIYIYVIIGLCLTAIGLASVEEPKPVSPIGILFVTAIWPILLIAVAITAVIKAFRKE